MAEARRGLGRGLSALLGDPSTPAPNAPPSELRQIALGRIRPNPDQPRTRIDEAALAALAESISTSGVVQPVVVRPADASGAHELIAGERRWRAAGRAGLEAIPALVRDADDRERLELALVENMVREDLNAIEVATACAVLIEDFGLSHAEVARRLGRSRPAVSNLLRLLELPDDVQSLVVDGDLSEGAARAVLMADGARARRRLAARAAAEGLSVRQVEAAARSRPGDPGARRQAPPANDEALDDALEAFATVFGVPARTRARAGGAVSVELRFPDDAALAAALVVLARASGAQEH